MVKITEVISDTNIGGAGILLSSVVEGLAGEFEFEIILPKGSLLSSRLPTGVKITELPVAKDKSFKRKDVKTYYNYLKSHKPHILHTHAALSARIAGKLCKIGCCISTRHCATAEAKRVSRIKRRLYDFCTDITVSTADYATENLICEGLKKDKIVTIKNGVQDLGLFDFSAEFSALPLAIPKDKRIIGSVARMERIKGQDLIIRAAPEILKAHPDCHFLFVGDGSLKEEYIKLASKLGIADSVSFTGYVPAPAVYQKLFYINVNASRGTETSCLATSEAMSLGIPSVVSSFGGNVEMIKNGINGFVFNSDNPHDLAKALGQILSDSALHRKLSLGARQVFCESFSLSRMLDEYRRLYNSVKISE